MPSEWPCGPVVGRRRSRGPAAGILVPRSRRDQSGGPDRVPAVAPRGAVHGPLGLPPALLPLAEGQLAGRSAGVLQAFDPHADQPDTGALQASASSSPRAVA